MVTMVTITQTHVRNNNKNNIVFCYEITTEWRKYEPAHSRYMVKIKYVLYKVKPAHKGHFPAQRTLCIQWDLETSVIRTPFCVAG